MSLADFPLAPSAGRRVLIADDDRNLRAILEAILVDQGYEVWGAGDGLEALAAIERMPPLLLLLDLRMPRLGGLEVLEHLRNTERRFPVIVITAQTEAVDAVVARGAAGVLVKPVGLDLLIETVRAAVDRSAP